MVGRPINPKRLQVSFCASSTTASFANTWPITSDNLSRMAEPSSVLAGRFSKVLPLSVKINETSGVAMASCFITSIHWPDSVRCVFRNLRLAGILSNRSLTLTVVPTAHATGSGA